MAVTTKADRIDSHQTLLMALKRQPQLYDLHTHLLGMGNAFFWIDSILMNEDVMPTDQTFRDHENKQIRQKLCPLVWDQTGNTGFVKGNEAADFFFYITEEITLPNKELEFNIAMKQIPQKIPWTVLKNLIDEAFYYELLDRNLTFRKNFSYDVVLTLSDLGKGLGVKDTVCEDLVQVIITEKLGIYPPAKIDFREWIIFNAREQKFQVVYGIQVKELRDLIRCDPNAPGKANELARAYIINAFSMRDAEGTPARHVDLHNFHGSFTPDFYPRRFALKDSIYSQRLDVLAMLIAHIIERYQTCLPPVKYCEFSISVNDLSRPWVYDVLRSVRVYDKITKPQSQLNEEEHIYLAQKELSSFAQLALYGNFPHLAFAFNGPESDNDESFKTTMPQVTYKFLVGFDRRKIKSSKFKDVNEALRFLLEYPQQAILLMMREIVHSKSATQNLSVNTSGQPTTTIDKEDIFSDFVDRLKLLESKEKMMPAFDDWVVGIDLFGDELGYPYCPFVARPFIEYIKKRRQLAEDTGSKNIFGVRIHCGENVTFADDNTKAYRLFVAHMYIVFRSLRFLQQELEFGIRIGHGIAFDRIFGDSMGKLKHRKSSVLLAEIREHAKHLMKAIAFEVNITSNEYLLGQTLRQGDNKQPLRLDGLFGKIPIILATDDDGVWPIDQCSFTHPGHQSLAAEYCRAISSGLINNIDQLTGIFKETKNFCFWKTGGTMPQLDTKDLLPIDDNFVNTVIIHPDIIRRLLLLYDKKTEKHPGFERFAFNKDNIDPVEWNNEYGVLRVAFICICANHNKINETEEAETKSKVRSHYYDLFGENATEFDTIYNYWREVRFELIFSDTSVDQSQTPGPGHYVLLDPINPNSGLVYSPPEPDNSEQSRYKPLTDFIHQFRLFGSTIHAYGNEIDIKKTVDVLQQAVDAAASEKAYRNMTLYLYTNTNVYTYVSCKLGKNFNLKINPHPSKRDKKKESFLYVLCSNGSAATSALHMICDRIRPEASGDNSDFMIGVTNVELTDSQQPSSPIPKELSMKDLKPKPDSLVDDAIINHDIKA